MEQKCTLKPVKRICFQWFSNLKTYPEWVKTMPNWAIQRLNNGDWIVQESNTITWYNNETFHELYDVVD